ncbi:hypothetical protein CF319_g6599 [Tilletia indica]|uniref:Uncharacterized protein n=2 Tax=Tilletia TaxID=13289 RepID=A0A8X7T8C2_9BASI|nr:hypothetical protein CF327_g1452 [Tilletia walkeri]KAE8219766.1 hypothetical protein CF319_g6599 [Tilletia indica]KAE8228764.1 hypothetical protein CF326_g6293 [Tilletia indica]KAE8255120.1 hypothetical protein A4X13_0g3155 [Tilletia indica]KAE8271203.1 hypothetical protein A4X09_0g1129 [Tilletia walkeri]
MATIEYQPKVENALLRAYLTRLQAHPLLTKQQTSALASASGELLATRLSGVPPAKPTIRLNGVPGEILKKLDSAGISERVLLMGAYGFFVAAPLGHVLTGALQRAFAGRTTARDKILQIIAANLITSPINNAVYIASMAFINGARSVDQIVKTVQASFSKVMVTTWITSPLAIAYAQNYLQPELWEPFFVLLKFVMGTYFNTLAKKKQMELARQERLRKGKEAGKRK